MAKVEFKSGIKCTQCGNMIVPKLYSNELCQKCGAHIVNIDIDGMTYSAANKGKDITIKITHKLFHDIYEEV